MSEPYPLDFYTKAGIYDIRENSHVEGRETIQSLSVTRLMTPNVYSPVLGKSKVQALPSTTMNTYIDGSDSVMVPSSIPIEQFERVAQPVQNPSNAPLNLVSMPSADVPNASCLYAICWWRDETTSGMRCGVSLSCDGVPDHLKDFHHIKNLPDSESVVCRWEGCSVHRGRKNFARHVRERHLGHSREKGHST